MSTFSSQQFPLMISGGTQSKVPQKVLLLLRSKHYTILGRRLPTRNLPVWQLQSKAVYFRALDLCVEWTQNGNISKLLSSASYSSSLVSHRSVFIQRYLLVQFRKQAFVLCILQYQAELSLLSETAVKLDDVWIVHKQLQLDLLHYLTLHLLLLYLNHIDLLQSKYRTSLLLFNHID